MKNSTDTEKNNCPLYNSLSDYCVAYQRKGCSGKEDCQLHYDYKELREKLSALSESGNEILKGLVFY